VAVADNESGLEKFQDSERSLALTCDAIDPDSVASVVEKAHSHFGRVTGVANCVGNMVLKPAHLTDLAEFRSSLDMNLVSAFNVVKGSVRHMMQSGGGSIALCSAAVAHRGFANIEAVAAAKGGVASLSQAAAATYAEHDIRVNCVAPGVVDTPMTEQLTKPEGARKDTEGMLPLHNKITSPQDVATALEFLLRPSNSMITGALLTVDGGMSVMSPR
jgi:NAD(P)-dependent dehydrogenase (short-subunit alcohol dehydrogenase family)